MKTLINTALLSAIFFGLVLANNVGADRAQEYHNEMQTMYAEK